MQFPNYGTCASTSLRSAQRVPIFNSEVHSASALLPCSHHHGLKTMPARLSGNRFEAYSSSSTFLDIVGRDFMTEGGECQEVELFKLSEVILIIQHSPTGIDWAILSSAVAEDPEKSEWTHN